ncbi:MAG: DNA circularization N-terminal domain-containing protein [Janthinobacterium lividum]
MNFDPIQSITSSLQAGVNTVVRAAADIGLGGVGGAGGAWMDQLRPASYRGVPFAVLSSQGQFGRRNAVHEYPYRDKVWVEDLGRQARRINVAGFLIEKPNYGGVSSVIAQREKLIAACETAGDGELIHPTLGRMIVSNMVFSVEETWDRGGVFEFTLGFIEAGTRIFPAVATSTTDAVDAACKAADLAVSKDFLSAAGDSIKQGASVVSQAVSTAANWGRQAQRLANDATNLYNMVGTLKGGFGRFFSKGGISNISVAGASLARSANTVPGLIALGSVARSKVSEAIDSLTSTAAGLGL